MSITETGRNRSVVYFIKNRYGEVKIGKATNVSKRLSQLKSGSPSDLYVFRTISGGIAEEKWLHKHFNHLRIRGEWFKFSEEMETITPPEIHLFKEVSSKSVLLEEFGERWIVMNQEAIRSIACNRKQIGGEGFAVLLALTVDAKFNNEFAVVNQSEMADQLGMKRSNVSRSIKRLVEFGIILEKKPDRGVSKMYCLNPEFAWKGKAKDHVPAMNSKVSYELKRRLDERKGS